MKNLYAITRLLPLLGLSAWSLTTHGATLSGLILDDGDPVARAEATLVNAAGGVILDRAWSDGEGQFRFTVDPGVYHLGAFKPGHAGAWSKGVVVRGADVSVQIELTPKELTDNPDALSGDCD